MHLHMCNQPIKSALYEHVSLQYHSPMPSMTRLHPSSQAAPSAPVPPPLSQAPPGAAHPAMRYSTISTLVLLVMRAAYIASSAGSTAPAWGRVGREGGGSVATRSTCRVCAYHILSDAYHIFKCCVSLFKPSSPPQSPPSHDTWQSACKAYMLTAIRGGQLHTVVMLQTKRTGPCPNLGPRHRRSPWLTGT